jgi:thiamine biosynthesis lipoprotein
MSSCSVNYPELRRCRPLLGTLVEITARGASPAVLATGLEAAFAAIAHAQSLLSFHDPSSELSRLNRDAARGAVRVDDWTLRVLALARRIHLVSDGGFDPVVPSPVGAQATFTDVIFLSGNRVRFARPLRLDLGGIAKGFAVDRAIEALRAAAVPAALVNAGGDLRVFGDAGWPIVVRDPASLGRLRTLGTLREGALATSAVYFSRRRTPTGRWTSAIINPRSHRPWLARVSVTVRAPDAATADALTKVLALHGPAAAGDLLAEFDAEGWWLGADGRVQTTPEAPCIAA